VGEQEVTGRPFLIAETPNAGPHGHRFLVPPQCDWDDARTARFVGLGRLHAERIGGNYIAVSRRAPQHSTGRSGDEVLVLVGVDTAKLSIDERDRIVRRLRDLLGDIDAVAARHPWAGEPRLVVPFPELEVWLESGFPPLRERSAENGPQEFGEPTGYGWLSYLIGGLILVVLTISIAETVRWLIVR
jgi:hypothetical protein